MGVRQELLTDCLNKSMKSVEATKTRVNINIFLSHDVPDDVFSDAEGTDNHSVSSSENSCLSVVIDVWSQYNLKHRDKKYLHLESGKCNKFFAKL